MLVKSEINAASDDELEIFAREVFKEVPEEMAENISNTQNWINKLDMYFIVRTHPLACLV
jgi:hypothetical protein